MTVLAIGAYPTDPNYDALARVISSHLDAALSVARVSRSNDTAHRWYVPLDQATALLALDPAELAAGQPSEELRDALEAAREERARRTRQRRHHEDSQAEVCASIDRDGDQVDLNSVVGHGALRSLDAERRATLARAVDRAWPPFASASGDLPIDDLVLHVGAEIDAPLPPDRWWQVLDAYIPGTGIFGIHRAALGQWLVSTRPDGITDELHARIVASTDAGELSRLLIVADVRDARIVGAARERLLSIEPDERDWLAAARYLIECGARSDIEAMLDHAGAGREHLVAVLAREGERSAQFEIIETLITQVTDGKKPEPPTWPNASYDGSFCKPFSRLAEVAPEGTKALSFGVNGLAEISDLESLTALEQLAARRIWWIDLAVEQVAAQLASARVLQRLDDSVLVAAREFLAFEERDIPRDGEV